MNKLFFSFHLVILLMSPSCLFAKGIAHSALSDTLPVPKGIPELLFYVQRDPNTNTVVYELNQTEDGTLNEKDPVHVFWIRYADNGEHKELNYIQRKFAYGLNSKKLAQDQYELKFVCYSKISLYLKKCSKGNYRVYTTINGKEAMLDRVFVRIEGGSFWLPNIVYIELQGRELTSGKIIASRFKP